METYCERACVLLKINLYWGNKFWMYFMDFVNVSLVSWMIIIAVFICVWIMRPCKLGKVVLSEDTFEVIMFVSRLVLLFILVVCVGTFGGGGGWEYSYSVSKHLRDSCINLFGRKGNLFWITVGVGGISWLCMKVYNSLFMELWGCIMSWCVVTNFV